MTHYRSLFAKFFAVIMLVGISTISQPAKAQNNDCSKIVDLLCDAFNQYSYLIRQCASVDEFAAIDDDAIMERLSVTDISTDCFQYQLTKDDKAKLIRSTDKFFDTMIDKMYEFCGDRIDRNQVALMVEPSRKKATQQIMEADTALQALAAFHF